MKTNTVLLLLSLLAALSGPAFAELKESKPTPPAVPAPDASLARVREGFYAEVLIKDLTYPTSIETDDQGMLYVAEAGYSYGDDEAAARVLRLTPTGELSPFVAQGLHGPINDLLWHQGSLYVSHRGRISVITRDGRVRDLVRDLPSGGDHHNNQMTVGPDGKLYFGQGTVTNSGVVGPDNEHMGWLRKDPNLHDIPARTIEIETKLFKSANPLRAGGATAHTLPYHPFNSGGEQPTTIEGATKASGTILRTTLDGGRLEMVAWGLRNPYGLVWTPDGKLYATENGMDERGSRPVANDREDLYEIREGKWYGWPDYASGLPVTDDQFAPKEGPEPEFLMKEHPPVERPLVTFPKHSAVTKLAVSPGGRFGPAGRLFIAFFGHMSPMTGETTEHGGHRVAVVDPRTGQVEEFFSKKGPHSASGSKHENGGEGRPEGSGHQPNSDSGRDGAKAGLQHSAAKSGEKHARRDESVTAGPRRLVDVHFAPEGDALYIVDFGTLVIKNGQAVPAPGTGVVWRILPADAPVPGHRAGISARASDLR